MGDAQKQITLKENTPKEAEKTLKILSDYIKPFLELWLTVSNTNVIVKIDKRTKGKQNG